jgi:hypothetical protein
MYANLYNGEINNFFTLHQMILFQWCSQGEWGGPYIADVGTMTNEYKMLVKNLKEGDHFWYNQA